MPRLSDYLSCTLYTTLVIIGSHIFMKEKRLFNPASIILGVIGILVMFIYAVNNHNLPTLGDMFASSTPAAVDAEDSDQITLSTTIVAATTTPPKPSPAYLAIQKIYPLNSQYFTRILFPYGKVEAIISSTTAERDRGLSFRQSLPTTQGMLFVFRNAGLKGFWMKDMHFPLDIIWTDTNRRVVTVLKGAQPDSYPNVFYPATSSQYVLELNAGQADEFGIATGTVLGF